MMIASMMASMLYRLVKTRMTWVFLGIYTAFIPIALGLVKLIGADSSLMLATTQTSSEMALTLSVTTPGVGGAQLDQLCGAMFVRGSMIAMFVAVFCGVFFASDLRSGSVKNLIRSSHARLSYAVSAAATAGCVCVAYVAVGAAATAASAVVTGVALAVPNPASFLAWCAQVAALTFAYSLLAVGVALLTRSLAASAVAGFLLGGAAVENLLYTALGLISGHPEEVRQLFDGYLAVIISQLGLGSVQSPEALAPVVITIVAAIAASVGIMGRRSLG